MEKKVEAEGEKVRERAFDDAWKRVLEGWFWKFMGFYFPDMAEMLDESGGLEFLDKELEAVVPEGKGRRRVVDKLAKVRLKGGEEARVLVHVEVQAYNDREFALRMYTYHYRLFDRYRKPVASLAVLADDDPGFRPSGFRAEALGRTFVRFDFPCRKILDWKGREEELRRDPDPFAVATLASLKAFESGFRSRYRWKRLLTRLLYDRGYDFRTVLDLYRFIDAVMVLPESMERELYREIREYEEERKMEYVTTAERIGIEKGQRIGIEKGEQIGIEKGERIGGRRTLRRAVLEILEVRFGEVPARIAEEIERIEEIDSLSGLHRKALLVPSLEDFEAALPGRAPDSP